MPIDSPTGVPIVGPGSPYITPSILVAASTGISWATIGGPGINLTPSQQLDEQLNICVRATARIDQICNQPLRATVDTEYFTGPGDFRMQNQPTGVTRVLLSRFPVLEVVGGQVSSAATIPYTYQSIPANNFAVEVPPMGIYGTSAPSADGGAGQAVLLAPGWVTWVFGRQANRLQVQYINGWPHGSIIAATAAADTTLHIDDITGWAGAAGVVYDAGSQEYVSCTTATPDTAGAISGPGVLTLQSPLVYKHAAGVLVSCLPATVQQAAIYLAVSFALTRGATATTVQTISGGPSGGGTQSQEQYAKMAEDLVRPYRRVI